MKKKCIGWAPVLLTIILPHPPSTAKNEPTTILYHDFFCIEEGGVFPPLPYSDDLMGCCRWNASIRRRTDCERFAALFLPLTILYPFSSALNTLLLSMIIILLYINISILQVGVALAVSYENIFHFERKKEKKKDCKKCVQVKFAYKLPGEGKREENIKKNYLKPAIHPTIDPVTCYYLVSWKYLYTYIIFNIKI